MADIEKYRYDPAYSICSRLSEYYEILSNYDDYCEYNLKEIEDELSDALQVFCDSASDDFLDLIDLVHQGLEEDCLDYTTIDDMVSCISEKVRHMCERGANWEHTYYELSSDTYAPSERTLRDILHNNGYQISFFDDLDERDFEELASSLRATAGKVYQYIMSHNSPVSKDALVANISNCTDRAIAIAVSRDEILNYRGLYIAAKYIDVSSTELREISGFLKQLLIGNTISHIDDVYDAFCDNFRDVAKKAFIQSSYQLFTFIEHYLGEDFSLSRPFIANAGVTIATPQERLLKRIQNMSTISVADFVSCAKEMSIKVNSILELIVSLNDHFLLQDRNSLVAINTTGITTEIADKVIQLIKSELLERKCVAIRDLQCIVHFPPISIPWDEWLIYSVVRKWGQNICTHTTSNQFRQSVPVVALPGAANEETIAEIAKKCSDLSYRPAGQLIDSLDDLDDLILGYEDLDLELEELI